MSPASLTSPVPSSLGIRPAFPASVCLGIDVGGTKIMGGALVFPGHQVVATQRIETQAHRGGRAVLDDVAGLCIELKAIALAQGYGVSAIGVGLCELVDADGRPASDNCVAWTQLPVGKELSTVAPAVIDADVRVAALAEAMFGAGRGYQSFLYVTVGTGISCSLVIEGRAYLGAHGVTGTMASSPLSLPCDATGQMLALTLEEIASGPALIARYNALSPHRPAITGRDVLAAYAAGEPHARRVVDTACTALGSQIGLLVNVLDPEAIVIGGGLGMSEGPYREQLPGEIRRHIWSEAHRALPIFFAACGEAAGWMGAAARAYGWKSERLVG